MLTRRQTILGAAALAASGFTSSLAWASDDALLHDILIGITDAVTRSYIREHWREGRWDGKHWWCDGRRYSMDEYRTYLAGRARPAPAPAPRQSPPPAPPAGGREPGAGKGPAGPGGGQGGPGGPGNPGRGPGGGGNPNAPGGPGPR